MVKTRDFNWIVNNGHFSRLVFDRGNYSGKNIFLLDTGTIIDLEHSYFTNGSRRGLSKEKHPAAILDRIALEYPLVITPRVLTEVRNHSRNHLANGKRPEISRATLELIETLYDSESREILELNNASLLNSDPCSLSVYLASKEAFKENSGKKKDEVSCADREMVALGVFLSKGMYGDKKINCVNILSPDYHILGTLNTLKTMEDFKQCRVRAIPTRSDLRDYMVS